MAVFKKKKDAFVLTDSMLEYKIAKNINFTSGVFMCLSMQNKIKLFALCIKVGSEFDSPHLIFFS